MNTNFRKIKILCTGCVILVGLFILLFSNNVNALPKNPDSGACTEDGAPINFDVAVRKSNNSGTPGSIRANIGALGGDPVDFGNSSVGSSDYTLKFSWSDDGTAKGYINGIEVGSGNFTADYSGTVKDLFFVYLGEGVAGISRSSDTRIFYKNIKVSVDGEEFVDTAFNTTDLSQSGASVQGGIFVGDYWHMSSSNTGRIKFSFPMGQSRRVSSGEVTLVFKFADDFDEYQATKTSFEPEIFNFGTLPWVSESECADMPENDNEPTEDPSEEPENNPEDPYDTETCFGVSEDEPPQIVGIPGIPFGWDSSKMKLVWFWDFETVKNWLEGYEERMQGKPSVEIAISPTDPADGDSVTVSLQAENFRTKAGGTGSSSNKTYSAVFISSENDSNHRDQFGDRYSGPVLYNTVSAGGVVPQMVIEGTPNLGDLCRDFTRIPEIDSDGDSMDDDWEYLHFAGTNKCGPLNDTYCGDSKDQVIQMVSPDADPDEDGAEATRFKNDDEKYATPISFMRKGIAGGGVKPETYIVGNANKDGLKDGSGDINDLTTPAFMNWQEYVAGTNPINSDTDGDGVTDEKEIYGEGFSTIEWMAKGEPHDEAKVNAIVIGISQRKDLAIVSKESKIYMGDGSSQGKLSVVLNSSLNPIVIGQPVDITATAQGSVSGDSSSVSFEWGLVFGTETFSICDTMADGDNPRCGLGKDTWMFNTNDFKDQLDEYFSAGNDYLEVYVEATDTISGKKAEARLKLYIGTESLLRVSGCYKDTLGLEAVECSCYVSNTIDPTETSCGLQGENLMIGTKGETFSDDELKDMLFEWSIDGDKISESSGSGYQDYRLADGTDKVMKRDSMIIPIMKNGGDSYEVELLVSRIDTGERVDGGKIYVGVGNPSIDLSVNGASIDHGEEVFNIGDTGTYTIDGQIYNIPLNSEYEYKFMIDNIVIGSGASVYDSVGKTESIDINSSYYSSGRHNIKMTVSGATSSEATSETEVAKRGAVRRFFGEGYGIINITDSETGQAFMDKARFMASGFSNIMASAVRVTGVAGLAFVGFYGILRLFDKRKIF